MSSAIPAHVYEVRPRKDHRGVDLISDAVRFGRLWYNGRKPCFGDPDCFNEKAAFVH
jgi:hypothetical protein